MLPVTPEDAEVKAWVPGTLVPTHAHAEGTAHTLTVDWVLEEDSVDELTDHSALILNGRVESTRFDVIRTWAESKLEGQPTGEASGSYSDLPVTIATVRIGDLARASLELKGASGGALARGATVDVMFPGGLLADGCTLEPPTARSWCGIPLFGYKWCRRHTNITFTDLTGPNWPVGDAMNAWMYTSYSNSLYLHWRGSGTSDVMVHGGEYGYTGIYGYARNYWTCTCSYKSNLELNNTYRVSAHHAKTVTIHEIGHSLGLNHHRDCNSIMYSNPTACAAAVTSCDAQAASELYPY